MGWPEGHNIFQKLIQKLKCNTYTETQRHHGTLNHLLFAFFPSQKGKKHIGI